LTYKNLKSFGKSFFVVALTFLFFGSAQAKWNDAWKERAVVVIDTSPTGVGTKAAVNQMVVPVRLHTGNFEFPKAKSDGSDLRFIAADDKTELSFQIEYFDPSNELAVIWVALPVVLPNAADQKIYLYYGNPAATSATKSAQTFDANAIAIVHGPDSKGAIVDASAAEASVVGTGLTAEVGGAMGSAFKLAGAASVTVSGPNVKLNATGTTISLWVRSVAANVSGSLVKINAEGGSLELKLDAGVMQLSGLGAFGVLTGKSSAPVTLANWTQVTIVIGEKATVLVNGAEQISLAIKPVATNAQFIFGAGFTGDLDELQIFSVARSPEWLKASFAAQGPEGKMIRVESGEAKASDASYFKILIDNLPVDAIVVIALLGVMLLVAIWVVINKAILISRTARANREFLSRYRDLGDAAFISDQIPVGMKSGGFANSTLYPVFDQARVAMLKRLPGGKGKLEARNMPAIKSAVDTAVVGQNSKMNRWMVLLTIAISGGPFLGLLGTVVGVMITFAAIAAVGDVNINAIAPGIASALLATVAGLAVAIPALFAYNYLASQIKEVTTDTAVFGEEVISSMSEAHGA
jgi:biopolymer transport protein ExbB